MLPQQSGRGRMKIEVGRNRPRQVITKSMGCRGRKVGSVGEAWAPGLAAAVGPSVVGALMLTSKIGNLMLDFGNLS
ncbi:hypothetical protein V6N13_008772 [Hibiscus sabdariffa]